MVINSFADVLMSWQLWALFSVLLIAGVGSRQMKKQKIKPMWAWVLVGVGFLFAVGVISASTFGIGTIGGLGSNGVDIVMIQATTAYTLDNDTGGIDVADSGIDDSRRSIFYLSEATANGDALIENGVHAVTRKGGDAASCEVRIIKPASYDISDTTYRIVTQDVDTSVMNAYISTSATSHVADISDPKETNQLGFIDGATIGYVSVLIEVDETGVDPLTQYAEKDIRMDICGYPYTFTIVKADA